MCLPSRLAMQTRSSWLRPWHMPGARPCSRSPTVHFRLLICIPSASQRDQDDQASQPSVAIFIESKKTASINQRKMHTHTHKMADRSNLSYRMIIQSFLRNSAGCSYIRKEQIKYPNHKAFIWIKTPWHVWKSLAKQKILFRINSIRHCSM